MEKTVAAIQGVVSAEKKDDKNLRIKYSGGLDIQENVLSELVRLNIGVVSYKPATSALEESYLNLIKDTL
jgi:hypothetical protein